MDGEFRLWAGRLRGTVGVIRPTSLGDGPGGGLVGTTSQIDGLSGLSPTNGS